MTRIEQEDSNKKGRFTIYEDDIFAGEMTYTWIDKYAFIIGHTGVEPDFEGKGYGKILAMNAVEFAREHKIKILPLCPYAKKVFDKDKSLENVRF
ncbi:MAG: GNAT family N-acetyltransferase [Paludibacteraceae bacterium]